MNKPNDTAILQNLIPLLYKVIRTERTEHLKQFSLTPVQHDVLLSLMQKNMTLSELSADVYLDSSTLVGVIERLEQTQHIKKTVDPKDRRKNILEISSKGKNLIKSIPQFKSNALSAFLDSLRPDEREMFGNTLKKIYEGFSAI